MNEGSEQQPLTPRASAKDHRISHVDPMAQRIWDRVSRSPLHSLWNFQGVASGLVWKRTWHALIDDNLISRAAELGFYFLFALFPTLVCASALLGLAAQSASDIYLRLLHYLALVVPRAAYAMVIETFNQTTAASTSGKLTLGLVAALWSASVGFSAIQDGMNTVYKVKETRPYWKARGSAILVTLLLAVLVTINLAVLLGGDFCARYVRAHVGYVPLAVAVGIVLHMISSLVALGVLMLVFATIYYYAPDLKVKCWHWMTPGAAVGIVGWIAASLGLRLYLHWFNTYTLTYGSLGAVIILLTWFYLSGLMLLIGAEINSEIQAAVVEREMKKAGEIAPQVSPEPGTAPAVVERQAVSPLRG